MWGTMPELGWIGLGWRWEGGRECYESTDGIEFCDENEMQDWDKIGMVSLSDIPYLP